jgi:hypothetical protein
MMPMMPNIEVTQVTGDWCIRATPREVTVIRPVAVRVSPYCFRLYLRAYIYSYWPAAAARHASPPP